MISQRIIAVRLNVRSLVAQGGDLIASVMLNPVLVWAFVASAPIALADRILARLRPATCDFIACAATIAAIAAVQVAAPSALPLQIQHSDGAKLVLASAPR